jgi:hypothetical protein
MNISLWSYKGEALSYCNLPEFDKEKLEIDQQDSITSFNCMAILRDLLLLGGEDGYIYVTDVNNFCLKKSFKAYIIN